MFHACFHLLSMLLSQQRYNTLRIFDRKIHNYEFAWLSPAFGGMLGACHGLELGFVFDTLDTPGLTGPQGMVGENPPVELARRMHQTWITFATTSDPGWAPYNTQQRSVMRINTTWETIADPRPVERQAWEGVR